MTAEQMAAVVKRLGREYAVHRGCIYLAKGLHWTDDNPLLGGDLLLVILNRAAEMGWKRCTLQEGAAVLVQFHRLPDWLGVYSGHNANELVATMLAFIQIPSTADPKP